MMKPFIIFLVFISFLNPNISWSSGNTQFGQVNIIKYDTLDYSIFHYYNASTIFKYEKAKQKIYGPKSVFVDSLNTQSFVIVKSSVSSDTLFKVPCPPFSDFLIVNGGEYFVGLSTKKLSQYNIVVYNALGQVLFMKSFSTMELKLTEAELSELSIRFPCYLKNQILSNHIGYQNGHWYLQAGIKYSNVDSVQSTFLGNLHNSDNHLFPRLGVNTGSLNTWYNQSDPDISIIKNETGIEKIVLVDNWNNEVEIDMKLEQFSLESFQEIGLLSSEELVCEIKQRTGISDYMQKKFDCFWQIQIGQISDRYCTKEQFLHQDSICLNTYADNFGLSLISCHLLLGNENGLISEYHIEKDGKIPAALKHDLNLASGELIIAFRRYLC